MENRDAPATKGDIADVSEKLDQLRSDTNEKFDQLRSEMGHQYNDVVERIADSQTQLLRAFYDFAQSDQKRMTALEGNEAAIRSRLATIEDRLLEVEKRLNMPPAA